MSKYECQIKVSWILQILFHNSTGETMMEDIIITWSGLIHLPCL